MRNHPRIFHEYSNGGRRIRAFVVHSRTVFVERALAAKRANTLAGTRPQADTSKLEEEIDQLVAPRQLYGLTQEEIEIVEGKG